MTRQEKTNVGEDVEKGEPSYTVSGKAKLVQPLWKTVWRFLKKLKIELPCDPAIALLGIYPKDRDVVKRRAICTPMFIAALSTISNLWKEPRCPSRDDWIKRWSIYTMEYYSAIKKNDYQTFAATWTGLEEIMLSEISQAEKDNYHIVSLIWNIRNRKISRRMKGRMKGG